MTRTADQPTTRSLCACAALLLAASVVGCGPRDATPMPEPPSLDFGKVNQPGTVEVVSASTVVRISGEPEAAPPDSLLRVTNLDTSDPVAVVQVRSDGGFEVDLEVMGGQELRFQVIDDALRGAPQDAIFRDVPTIHFEPSPRHDCLTLDPGFDVDATSGSAGVTLENGCSEPIDLASPRYRLGLAGFGLPSSVPLALAPGDQATLSVDVSAAPPSEDVLFVDATLGGTTLRYPVTVYKR